MIVTTALAVGFLGIAPQAMAVGEGTTSLSSSAAAQGVPKEPLGIPIKANIGSLIGLLNIAVQDLPIL
ncbi:hypothetical protein [Streptomyces sp. NPDC023588]|uniref:hypothetical protein n=1 Tax=Streptomyces sp. NPDC023588 TaxID=3154907 RepID=UPI0033F313D5